MSLREKILSKIKKDKKGCWLWQAYIHPKTRYAQCWNGETNEGAHRTAYKVFRGEIPDGLDIDHLCRVRHCVNPDHLEAVTRRTNLLRGIGVTAIRAKQTHCKSGHPLSGKNLIIRKNGTRKCRICKNVWWLKNYNAGHFKKKPPNFVLQNQRT